MGSSHGHPKLENNGGENASIVDFFGVVEIESDKKGDDVEKYI